MSNKNRKNLRKNDFDNKKRIALWSAMYTTTTPIGDFALKELVLWNGVIKIYSAS